LKKIISLAILAVFALSMAFAEFNPEYSDYQYYNAQDFDADWAYLEESFKNPANDQEKAAILWRMARTKLSITDDIPEESSYKEARLDGYGEAESLAQQSIDLNPTPDGYHWLSSAIGRIGQVNGPLNSLSKAKPMLQLIEKIQNDFNADMSDSWYVLGILYSALPGAPLSFGNNNYAISYLRRCLDTQDNVNRCNLTNYLELANQLYDRNWNASKRSKEFDKMQDKYNKESVPSEKMKFYEGRDGKDTGAFYCSASLSTISDRQEAVVILQYALSVYESRSAYNKDADHAKAEAIKARLSEIS
jgi:hypothetical protein